MRNIFIKLFTSKKFIITFGTILSLVLLCTIVGPYCILAAVKQPTPETHKYSEYFYTTYDDVRKHLKERVETLKENAIEVEYTTYAINEEDGLYIDNVYLPATETCTNLIVLTSILMKKVKNIRKLLLML